MNGAPPVVTVAVKGGRGPATNGAHWVRQFALTRQPDGSHCRADAPQNRRRAERLPGVTGT